MEIKNETMTAPNDELLKAVRKYIEENFIEEDYIEEDDLEEIFDDEFCDEEVSLCLSSIDEGPKRPKLKRVFSAPKTQRLSVSAIDAAEPAFELDESFSEMLFRKIDESGIKDSECYKKANVSKQIFSNIKSNNEYIPKKNTVLAFAIALRMDLSETKELLERAGYALSKSKLLDVIVEYFIENEKYDIDEINGVLFEYDQTLLGSK